MNVDIPPHPPQPQKQPSKNGANPPRPANMLFFVSIVPYTSIFPFVPIHMFHMLPLKSFCFHVGLCIFFAHHVSICFQFVSSFFQMFQTGFRFPWSFPMSAITMFFPCVCHISLDWLGNNYRKVLYLMVKTMVSCKFSNEYLSVILPYLCHETCRFRCSQRSWWKIFRLRLRLGRWHLRRRRRQGFFWA